MSSGTHTFTAKLLRFASKGEKSGWTYVEIPQDIIKKLALPNKKGFRIKGKADKTHFEKLSTYPMGDGAFIIAFSGELRRKVGKNEGAVVSISFSLDSSSGPRSEELLACLKQEPAAWEAFRKLPLSHQNYFHRYIVSAKGADTRAGRIVHTINAMLRGMNFGEMVRSLKSRP